MGDREIGDRREGTDRLAQGAPQWHCNDEGAKETVSVQSNVRGKKKKKVQSIDCVE